MRRDLVVATYRMQDASKACEHRDRLKADGQNAFLTMDSGSLRHGGCYLVHVSPPKNAEGQVIGFRVYGNAPSYGRKDQ